jgi:hypothetical protein
MTRQCAVCGRDFAYEPKPGRPPMTCSPECARTRKNAQSERSREALAAGGCPPEAHGTATGYTVYKCGCPKCSRWQRLYMQRRRAKLKAAKIG